MSSSRPLCGIFIGGAALRMGGYPKGLLPDPASGQPLVSRLAGLAEAVQLRCVLVGQRPEYELLGLPMLRDSPPGIGPLGGLAALLESAQEQAAPGVVALSCDLPRLSAALLLRLVSAQAVSADGLPWDVLAPQRAALWEPLCARYQPSVLPHLRQAIADGERSFQRLFTRLRSEPLLLSEQEQIQLDDWDTPDDLPPAS